MSTKHDNGMNEEDELSDVSADLLEMDRYGVFVERLLAENAGTWTTISRLCEGLGEIEGRIDRIVSNEGAPPQVTWIEYPPSLGNKGYCLVIFFSESTDWRSVAIYNKERFLRKRRKNG